MPDNETVTLKLPTGEMVDFVVPKGMSDAQVKGLALSKRPDLFKTPEQNAPDANAQAKQKLKDIVRPQIPGTGTVDPTGGLAEAQKGKQYQDYQKQSGQFAGTVAGTMGAGALVPAIKGAAGLALRSGASGAGAGVGALAGGANPQEAAATAAGAAIGQPIAEGATALAGTIAKNLPSALKSAAGQTLGTIKQVAGNTPVNTAHFGDTALELWSEKQAGAQLPQAVSKLVNRITQPNGQPLTYAETKSFQSNISALSANERMNLKPNTARLLGELNTGLKSSLEEASQLGGMQPGTFSGAMKQYSQAASRQEMVEHLRAMALKGAAAAAGGGAATYGVKKILGK